ncbi:hypothetical protein ACFY5J_04600 [Peribacillus butanolivorans]|uniref:hypothetical protein n=1 Tax=Peribacillus butanolivorans TaxID=421767 RepID=UPI0036791A4C
MFPGLPSGDDHPLAISYIFIDDKWAERMLLIDLEEDEVKELIGWFSLLQGFQLDVRQGRLITSGMARKLLTTKLSIIETILRRNNV